MVLLAAFAVLLARWSGQTDIVVGSPVAGRVHRQLENVVGFFVNILVLRTNVGRNITFRELIENVKETALQAYANQDLPFERLVAALSPPRDLSRQPIVQVVFSLDNSEHWVPVVPGLTICAQAFAENTSKCDLSLFLKQGSSTLEGTFEFATDIFDTSTIQRLVDHFLRMLSEVASDSTQVVWALGLTSDEERLRLLLDGSGPQSDHYLQLTHKIVSRQAHIRPGAIALQGDGCEMTYGELECRSNQLASYLQSKGVSPEVIVGVLLERSFDFVIAVLGIIKAGGAYLPLDPEWPQARTEQMIAGCRAAIVLTSSHLWGGAHPKATQVLDLDSADILVRATTPVQSSVQMENIAYVIYTSGSTGPPNATLIRHQGLANLVQAQIDAFEIDSRSQLLQFAPLTFDASVSEIFTALAAGATLHIASKAQLVPGANLATLLMQRSITVVTLPPSILHHLAEYQFPKLRTLVVAGEACPVATASYWAVGRRLINAYGPTEATVCASWALIAPSESRAPIGKPLANTQLYVLDDYLQPTSKGVAGVLFIAGAGLSRGYQNAAGLTANRFIANPFGPRGARMYCTGDLCRWTTDGNLEFLGRRDRQTKLLGCRIEPAEVENVLLGHPMVSQAVVVAATSGAITNSDVTSPTTLETWRLISATLVAYVVAKPDARVEPQTLRMHLADRLPPYMIPSHFKVVNDLPLTANGKIDRDSLLLMIPSAETSAYAAPTLGIEETLAAIWRRVLGTDRVGIDDNFFDLGGHSMGLTRILVEIKRLAPDDIDASALTIVDLYRYPTIRQLVSRYGRSRASGPAATNLRQTRARRSLRDQRRRPPTR
jgi:amino acid adenylation domain-containing protein